MNNTEAIVKGLDENRDLEYVASKHNIVPLLDEVLDAYNTLQGAIHRDKTKVVGQYAKDEMMKNFAEVKKDLYFVLGALEHQYGIAIQKLAFKICGPYRFEAIILIGEEDFRSEKILGAYTLKHKVNATGKSYYCAYHFLDFSPNLDFEMMEDEGFSLIDYTDVLQAEA